MNADRWQELRERIERWAKVAAQVERGYSLTFDDYLNDLDGRRLIDERVADVRGTLHGAVPEAIITALNKADEQFRQATVATNENVWGAENAAENNWRPDREWYYYRVPKRPQILFIQGAGETTHDAWDNKLVDRLRRELGAGFDIRYPRMPDEANPTYDAWSRALQQEFDSMRDDVVAIGHSVGATFLVNFLATHRAKRQLRAIILIAPPFVGEGGWPSGEWQLERELGRELGAETPVHLFQGSTDETVPLTHSGLFARAIPQAQLHILEGRDHQLNNDMREVADVIRALVENS